MSWLQDFIQIFTSNDTYGRKIKATLTPSDGTDILTNSDPTGGRRIKIELDQTIVSALTNASNTGVSLIENPSGVLKTLVQGTNISITDNGNGTITITGSSGYAIVVVANYSALPAANTVPYQFYWCSASQGTAWLPGSLGGTYYNSGLYYSNGVSWEHMDTAYQATQADVDIGTVTDQFVSPATFAGAAKWNNYVTSVGATSPITSSGGTTPTISTSMATNKLIGRSTAGTGVMEEITIGTGLSLSAGTLSSTASGGGLSHGTASGTDTYTVTIAGVAAYADGDAYLIRFTNGNTTSATLNINSLGAINIYRNNDGPLIGGDIQAGGEMLCVYNSTLGIFQAIGTSPNSIIAYVTNDDSVSITKGMPVYAFSGTGDRMTVKRADNTTDATSAQTMGLVLSTSIAAGQKGFIITQGLLDGLSTLPTSTYADGDAIYLGATAGAITNVKPYAPNHLVYLGVVTTASAGSAGRMYVKAQNGYELNEIHNIQAQSPTNKDTLYYDSADSQWKTAQIATILGYNPATSNLFSYYNFI